MKTTCRNSRFAILFAFCIAGASLAEQARADVTFNVNTVADQIDQDVADGICLTSTGACSLRAAIMQANHLSGPIVTRINLPAGIYVLVRPVSGANGEDNGDLNFNAPLSANQSVIIEGVSAATSVIDANQIDRVMSIAYGRVVTLSKVTVRGGYNVSTVGGGMFSQGALTILDSIVEANTANAGGGGVQSEGTLDIRRSVIRSNSGYLGGAVEVSGTATIRESSMVANTARFGGAIFTIGAILTFPASTLYILNSTISGNSARADGGGIGNEGNTYVVNTTISGNTADNDGGGLSNNGFASLYNTSIINNGSDNDRDPGGGIGGGVYNNPGRRLLSRNSLIADNYTRNAPIADDCNGELEVYRANRLSDFGGCTFVGLGVAGVALVAANSIGPLANNGGPTMTHALLVGSAAIDVTPAAQCVDYVPIVLTTDQRGAPRVAGNGCDAGAYEYGSVVPLGDHIYSNGFE